MLPRLTFWILAVQAMLYVAAKPFLKQSTAEENITPYLLLVTTVDGKSFFSDCTTSRSWTGASLFCQSMRMKLASVTTATQAAALGQAVGNLECYKTHWSSGRDADEARQFTWNSTGQALSAEFIDFKKGSNLPYKSCVTLDWSRPSNATLFTGAKPCTNEYMTMCET